MAPILEIRGLNHHFGHGHLQKQILFDINFTMMPGEVIILRGPSGSGKTTLLTLIGGLRTVQSGSVKVLGYELAGLSPERLGKIRRNIGFIFQGHNLLHSLTARQNVKMAAELHPLSSAQINQRVLEMLAAVGLSDHIEYYPAQLSGGQKQRVAIARALAGHPKLILADEPTAALDSKSGRAVVELMRKLSKEQDCTSLIVTHDNRILDVADRLVNLDDGHLSEAPLETVAIA
jgi:putative ABC transport system ATP-binding protein